MKQILIMLLVVCAVNSTQAQLLNKLKKKAQNAIEKNKDKRKSGDNAEPGKTNNETEETTTSIAGKPGESNQTNSLKVFSKFDFVPGKTILYFDNFENDNTGETPMGWLTTKSAEVVSIDGLEGNWLKMDTRSATHITRNKKQSWGNNFTVEFDMIVVPTQSSARFDITLLNTGSNLVTDEQILMDAKKTASVNFSLILDDEAGKLSRAMLYKAGVSKALSDATENLPYSNNKPIHVSICVQDKRYRLWWDSKKLYDLSAVDEKTLPNQLQFVFHYANEAEFYVSNIRVAKDVPDTRKQFEDGKLISNLLFYSGTANLKPESMGALMDVSKVIKDATSPVKIIGHTDSDGDETSNQTLSQQRAEAVKNILVSEFKIDGEILVAEGRGETQPLAGNKTAEGKAQNRRVEFIFKAEADKYQKPAGVDAPVDTKPGASKEKTGTAAKTSNSGSAAGTTSLQSKILTTSLPYSMILKDGDSYAFVASKEENNNKENYLRIEFKNAGGSLKPDTYNFKEINQNNPLYGTKKYPEITKTKAVLYYGTAKKPFIESLSPIIADGHYANYVSESLSRKLPPASSNSKLVIEKIEDGKASGYFTVGIVVKGLKPITKGDAMTETFDTGFAGELKGRFENVPIY
jgi:outer membrane protein OmpA-like peptidoglycan-associated protein